MKKTKMLLLSLFAVLSLSACSGASEESAAAKAEKKPEKPAEVVMKTDSEQKNLVTYFIAPARVDCTGVAPQKCLQVKKQKDEDWSLFYSNIDGFTFEEGYRYEIVVETEKIANPPMDSSSIRYKLVNIVSKESAQ